MKTTKKFIPYTPVTEKYSTLTPQDIDQLSKDDVIILEILKQFGSSHVLFFKEDETGRDFYAMQDEFSISTVKLALEPDTGVVHDAQIDVSKIVPSDLCIVEIENKDIPSDLLDDKSMTHKKYQYVNNVFSIVEKTENQKAIDERDRLMKIATTRITALVEAQDDGDITDAEKTELAALRQYRSLLRRADITELSKNFPAPPA